MGTPTPFDPEELAEEGLTEAEAEGLRRAQEALDRGEGVPGDKAFAEILAELQALSRVRRAG
ncbi:MAG: hypothetical protein HY909_06575 [Deltaproteobacteria bacterium]|nr:hypothetical protein [Deltaproteobacteria bacterium]